MKNYKKGYKGEDIKKYQSQLKIKSDGIFGSQTDSAVRNFQKQNGLVVDGIIGPKTRAAFEKLNSNNNSNNNSNSNSNNNSNPNPIIKSNISDITGKKTTIVGTRTKDIATLGNKLNNPDAVNYNAKEYLKKLEDRSQSLEDRKDKEFERINNSYDAQKEGLIKSQENESGTFRNKLVRMGGYLGDSASHVTAQIALDQEHRSEISALEEKRESALQRAREAYENKDYALADKEYQVARQAEKDTELSKEKYFNRQIQLQKEQRNEEKEDLQIYELKKTMGPGAAARQDLVLGMLDKGIRNPVKIMKELNYDEDGNRVNDYSLSEIANLTATFDKAKRNPNIKVVGTPSTGMWELRYSPEGRLIGKKLVMMPRKFNVGDKDKNNGTISTTIKKDENGNYVAEDGTVVDPETLADKFMVTSFGNDWADGGWFEDSDANNKADQFQEDVGIFNWLGDDAEEVKSDIKSKLRTYARNVVGGPAKKADKMLEKYNQLVALNKAGELNEDVYNALFKINK